MFTIRQVAELLAVHPRIVQDWHKAGVFPGLKGRLGLEFPDEQVWRLLPERLRKREFELVRPYDAVKILTISRNALAHWSQQNLFSATIRLPRLPGAKHSLYRYARHELELVMNVPVVARPMRLSTMASETGIPGDDLLKWIEAGRLPSKPGANPANPLVFTHDMRNTLISLHYDPL